MFTQRFGSALNSNLHFHALVTDGVFTCPSPFTRAFFHAADLLEDEHVEELSCRLHRRITRYLQRTGHLPRDSHGEDLPEYEPDEPLLAQLGAASVQGRVALGQASGRPITRLGRRRQIQPLSVPDELCCDVDGFSLHAKILVEAHERQLTYHGVLAPAAQLRDLVVPRGRAATPGTTPHPSIQRLPWAELLKRVFAIDALTCPWCGGSRKLIALLTDGLVVRQILAHLNLPTEPPPLAPARAPPEPAFDW